MVDDLIIEIGYRYRSSAVIDGAADQPTFQHPDKLRGAPGTRAPHVVLKREGKAISTLDLFGESFVLLAGPAGAAWHAAAAGAAKALGIRVDAWQVGGDGQLEDVDGRFLDAYGLGPAGAVLVRPDSFVAWHANDSTQSDGGTLSRVLSSVLARVGA
jgi:hypothetical protein